MGITKIHTSVQNNRQDNIKYISTNNSGKYKDLFGTDLAKKCSLHDTYITACKASIRQACFPVREQGCDKHT